MKKKIISVLLICSMLFSLMPISAFAEENSTVTSGSCGENATWEFDSATGVLTLGGEGNITAYTWNSADFVSEIKEVVIGAGITGFNKLMLGNPFSCCSALQNFIVEKDNTRYIAEDGVLFDTKCQEQCDGLGNLLIVDGMYVKKLISYPAQKMDSTKDETQTKYEIPSDTYSIGTEAFTGSRNLQEVIIPDNVRILEFDIFSDSGIEKVSIGTDARILGYHYSNEGEIICRNPFHGAANLQEIIVSEENSHFTVIDNVLFDKEKTVLYSYPCGKTDSTYTIPDTVIKVVDDAFSDWSISQSCSYSLEELIFGSSVKEFGEMTGLYNLNKLELNDGLEVFAPRILVDSNIYDQYIPASVIKLTGSFNSYTNRSLYFYGNAPEVDEKFIAYSDEPVTLYYLEDKTGWTTPKWNGYNTTTWGGNAEENNDVRITKLSPANGAENVGYTSDNPPLFQITFNTEPARINGEAVQLDETKEPFRIYRAEDNELIYEESTDTDFTDGYSGNITSATGSKTVTIEPTNRHILLEKNTEYYITIGEGYMKFADGSVSPAIEKGDWSFRTKNPDVSIVTDVSIATGDHDTKNAVVSVEWKDSWFDNSSGIYMHDLATAAMALSGASYVEVGNRPDSDAIYKALGRFDFDYIEPFNYEVYRTEAHNNLVSYTFAAKPVEDNGNSYTLVAVVIKGTSSDEEWYSNFNIGQGSKHAGFQTCAEDVMSNLEQYIEDLGLDSSNAKFLVTGHSRGAAVANLVAKEITDSSFAQTKNVYGYTFATPAVTTDSNASKYTPTFQVDSLPPELSGKPNVCMYVLNIDE